MAPLYSTTAMLPEAVMTRPIVMAKLRRIERGRDPSIEEEGVAAAEAVAEKAGKVVKVHPSLSDDEMYLLRAR
jgi:hypothetical protein